LIVNVTPLESTPIRAAPIGSGRLGLSEGFEAEGDVDAVAEDIVLLKDHVAEIDPDPKQDTPLFGDTPLAVEHPALDLYSAAHSVRTTLENSDKNPSPVFFSVRPLCSLIFGSTNCPLSTCA
jgi:hypothetical protein